ncbi:unnamed protein product [Dovyalis caffra]|uniref:Uncharacterized protein n=1 Tax=Dovyalis caffra TaxID=77055 RepID=A0AAV1S283_9ROSI|nr:unnamed protein product [Dovyalis caffra]
MEASSIALLACASAFVAALLLICLCKLGFHLKEVEQSKPVEENGTKIKDVDEDYGTIEEGHEAGDSSARSSLSAE